MRRFFSTTVGPTRASAADQGVRPTVLQNKHSSVCSRFCLLSERFR